MKKNTGVTLAFQMGTESKIDAGFLSRDPLCLICIRKLRNALSRKEAIVVHQWAISSSGSDESVDPVKIQRRVLGTAKSKRVLRGIHSTPDSTISNPTVLVEATCFGPMARAVCRDRE